jgi:glycogen synthase
MAKQVLDIGFFSTMYSQVNGTAHAVRFLSEAIAKLGHNVHVFAPRYIKSFSANTIISIFPTSIRMLL